VSISANLRESAVEDGVVIISRLHIVSLLVGSLSPRIANTRFRCQQIRVIAQPSIPEIQL
jgi:hypothetical protein